MRSVSTILIIRLFAVLAFIVSPCAADAITYEEIFDRVAAMPDIPDEEHESVSAIRIFATLGIENARLVVRLHEDVSTNPAGTEPAPTNPAGTEPAPTSPVDATTTLPSSAGTKPALGSSVGTTSSGSVMASEGTIYSLMSQIPSSQLVKGYLDDKTLFSIFAEPKAENSDYHKILILFDSAIKGDAGALIGEIRDYNLDRLRNAMLIRQPSGAVSIYLNTLTL